MHFVGGTGWWFVPCSGHYDWIRNIFVSSWNPSKRQLRGSQFVRLGRMWSTGHSQ